MKIWQSAVVDLEAGAAPDAVPGTIVRADKTGIQVATAQGVLNLLLLQPAGKKPMSAQDLLNSRREWFTPGTILV